MAKIIKRIGKWVEWISKKSQSKGTPTQASPSVAASSSSQGAMINVMPSAAQGLAQLARGGDQPLEKNIPLDKTCHDGSHPVIGTHMEEKKEEEKKVEESKDNVVTPPPSPHVAPVLFPHVTPVPSP